MGLGLCVLTDNFDPGLLFAMGLMPGRGADAVGERLSLDGQDCIIRRQHA